MWFRWMLFVLLVLILAVLPCVLSLDAVSSVSVDSGCLSTKGGGPRPPPFVEPFVDEAIKQKLLGYMATCSPPFRTLSHSIPSAFGSTQFNFFLIC